VQATYFVAHELVVFCVINLVMLLALSLHSLDSDMLFLFRINAHV
jgi:hypothetical protein